jgi:hypothetical protein
MIQEAGANPSQNKSGKAFYTGLIGRIGSCFSFEELGLVVVWHESATRNVIAAAG